MDPAILALIACVLFIACAGLALGGFAVFEAVSKNKTIQGDMIVKGQLKLGTTSLSASELAALKNASPPLDTLKADVKGLKDVLQNSTADDFVVLRDLKQHALRDDRSYSWQAAMASNRWLRIGSDRNVGCGSYGATGTNCNAGWDEAWRAYKVPG